MNQMDNFKDRLRYLIEVELDIPQTEFGKSIGVIQSQVSKWLNKESVNNPTRPQLEEISKVYNINTDWLFTGNGEKFINDKKPEKANMHIVNEPEGNYGPKSDYEKLKIELEECQTERLELFRKLQKFYEKEHKS